MKLDTNTIVTIW